ncbi:MAG: TetR/AcrR family transcriptional regulator [Bacteroidota bacterium]
MPKKTFENLALEKRKKFIDAFLKEFSSKKYDDASVTSVVKELGIAKGSIYQYFNNKLDLFLFLKSECEKVKMQYVLHVKREDFPDFWTYFKALYEEGIRFDKEHPLESNFLHNMMRHIDSPTIKQFHDEWFDQVIKIFSAFIQYEVDIGHFRNDIPVKSMAFFIYSISIKIGEYMAAIHGVDIQKNLESGKPVFGHNKGETLLKSVDENILILKQAIQKQTP